MYYAKGADLGWKHCCYVMASAFETGDDMLGLDDCGRGGGAAMLFTRCSKDDLEDDDWWEYAKQWLCDNGVDETVL